MIGGSTLFVDQMRFKVSLDFTLRVVILFQTFWMWNHWLTSQEGLTLNGDMFLEPF
jgi:hypothetical protein